MAFNATYKGRPRWTLPLPWGIISEISGLFDLDPCIVAALIKVESCANPWANRYEAGYEYLVEPSYHAKQCIITVTTERHNQKSSWGLMQVMGGVARENSFEKNLPMLCDPATGIHYGCKHLRQMLNKYGNYADGLASYNYGFTLAGTNQLYKNDEYVKAIISIYNKLRNHKQEKVASPF